MKNVKTLTATILVGMGLLMGGCGSNTNLPTQAQPTQQTQEVQQTEGISLAKAIDLASKGQFNPQKVKVEGFCTDKVWGDEPYITIKSTYNYNGDNKFVKIQVNDPKIIKGVAERQEKQKKTFVNGYATIDVNEIIIGQYEITVK